MHIMETIRKKEILLEAQAFNPPKTLSHREEKAHPEKLRQKAKNQTSDWKQKAGPALAYILITLALTASMYLIFQMP